jgi:ectoine hydroxylase-related dioxygenase (phytanoyl-CoA dioxygenase family)
MTTHLAASGLSADGLSEDQQLHFAEHGWVLLENVLDEAQCHEYVDAVERVLELVAFDEDEEPHDRGFRNPHLYDAAFLRWFKIPGLLEANRQLIGYRDIRFFGSIARCTDPHPRRVTGREKHSDPEHWAWHRDFEPRWINHPHPSDPLLINSTVIVNATYFTPVSPERGVTGFLDGSHRHAADQAMLAGLPANVDDDGASPNAVDAGTDLYRSLNDRCPVVQPTAGTGSVVMFTEALVHAGVPVLAEERRVAAFTKLCAPWIAGDFAPRVQPERLNYIVDPQLRSLFRPPVADSYR